MAADRSGAVLLRDILTSIGTWAGDKPDRATRASPFVAWIWLLLAWAAISKLKLSRWRVPWTQGSDGKCDGRDVALAALAPGGLLVVAWIVWFGLKHLHIVYVRW